MGVFDFIKNRKKNLRYAKMMNGSIPIFSQFGDDIYASDVVLQAVRCIANEMSKLCPTHVRKENGVDVFVTDSKIQPALDSPNPLMSTGDFIEKIVWCLFSKNNAWILPVKENKKITALYPLYPISVDFMEDNSSELFVKLRFLNGCEYTFKYSGLIHIRRDFNVNEFMGGDRNGEPNNDALLKTLQLNDVLLQGISKGLKASFAVNAVVKYNTMLDEGKTEQAVKELEKKILASESGFLPIDLKSEIIPFKRDIKLIDGETLKFIDEKILRYFGVPLCILTGDYTKAQYEAFYQKTLEPLIIKFGQAFTRGVFSDHESYGYKNEIVFYSKELIFMDTTQKLEMIRLLGDSGALYENEKRTAFGLRPLPELDGVRKQSLNYVDVNIANQYQLGDDKNEKNKKQAGTDS